MVLPLINDYKKDFISRQIVETFFGGARFRIANNVPCCFHFYQLLLFLSPALFGLVSTYVVSYNKAPTDEAAARIGGLGLAATAFALRLLAAIRHCPRLMRNLRMTSGKLMSNNQRLQVSSSSNIGAADGDSCCQDHESARASAQPAGAQQQSATTAREPASLQKQATRNSLLEENPGFESCCVCCSKRILYLLLSNKKHWTHNIIHPILAGLVCYFSIQLLIFYPEASWRKLFPVIADQALILGFSWLAICIAIHPLIGSPPAEPNVYRALDSTWQLSVLSRPCHVLIIYGIIFASQRLKQNLGPQPHPDHEYFSEIELVSRTTLTLLPLMWSLGMLPQVEPGLLWLLEQLNIFLLGGSTMSSPATLAFSFLLGVASAAAVHFLDNPLLRVCVAAGLGYLCSLGFGANALSMLRQLRAKIIPKMSNKDDYFGIHLDPENSPEHHNDRWRGSSTKSNIFTTKCFRNCVQFVWHAAFLVWACLIAGLTFYLTTGGLFPHYPAKYNTYSNVTSDFGGGISHRGLRKVAGQGGVRIIAAVLFAVFEFPKVTVFGVFQNRWYNLVHHPAVRARAISFKLILKQCTSLYLVFLCAYCEKISPTTNGQTEPESRAFQAFRTLSLFRAFRAIWHTPEIALLDFALTDFGIAVVERLWHIDFPWLLMGAMITCFLRDRIMIFMDNLFAFFAIFLPAILNPKLSNTYNGCLFVMNILFLPVTLAALAMSAILSCPVLPLFTLPIFSISYPRPLRLWPFESFHGQDEVRAGQDSVYYVQAARSFRREFAKMYILGALGTPTPGDMYLSRYEDKLLWVTITEIGNAYMRFCIKGLELQETSCHTVEAARVDDIFQAAFDFQNKNDHPCVSGYSLHSLSPMCDLRLRTYSETRNVLTGVIDSPYTQETVRKLFRKTMTWLYVKDWIQHMEALAASVSMTGSVVSGSKETVFEEEPSEGSKLGEGSAVAIPDQDSEDRPTTAVQPFHSTVNLDVEGQRTVEHDGGTRSRRPSANNLTLAAITDPIQQWASRRTRQISVASHVGRVDLEDGRATEGFSNCVIDTNGVDSSSEERLQEELALCDDGPVPKHRPSGAGSFCRAQNHAMSTTGLNHGHVQRMTRTRNDAGNQEDVPSDDDWVNEILSMEDPDDFNNPSSKNAAESASEPSNSHQVQRLPSVEPTRINEQTSNLTSHANTSAPDERVQKVSQRHLLPPIERRMPAKEDNSATTNVDHGHGHGDDSMGADGPTRVAGSDERRSARLISKTFPEGHPSLTEGFLAESMSYPPMEWLQAPEEAVSRETKRQYRSPKTNRRHDKKEQNRRKEFNEWFTLVFKQMMNHKGAAAAAGTVVEMMSMANQHEEPHFSALGHLALLLNGALVKAAEILEKTAEIVVDNCSFALYGDRYKSSQVDQASEDTHHQMQQAPKEILDIFKDDLSGSGAVRKRWLTESSRSGLRKLAVKAHRYAVKLAFDHVLIGPTSGDEELAEAIQELDDDWFLGSDDSKEWQEAILKEVPQLFDLGYVTAKKTYTSHLVRLSNPEASSGPSPASVLQRSTPGTSSTSITVRHSNSTESDSSGITCYVGKVSGSLTRGIWANLIWELLYLTNDDEERYSVQAHPMALRNLVVQAADPPLGYPIYVSDVYETFFDALWNAQSEAA